MTPVHTFATQMPLSSDYEVEQCSHSQEITLDHNCEYILAALPPSFTSLLTNCCTEVKQGGFSAPVVNITCSNGSIQWSIFLNWNYVAAASPAASKEVDLKSQIAVSFQFCSLISLMDVFGHQRSKSGNLVPFNSMDQLQHFSNCMWPPRSDWCLTILGFH